MNREEIKLRREEVAKRKAETAMKDAAAVLPLSVLRQRKSSKCCKEM